MKKFLLSLVIVLTYSVNAQQTISFEASEGYTIGSAEGQGTIKGYWDMTEYPTEYETMSIANTRATSGTNSLEFESDLSAWDWYDGVVMPITPQNGSFTITFDVYPEADDASDVVIYGVQLDAANDGYKMAAGIIFNWEGDIRARQGAAFATVGTYTAGSWYNVKMVYNYSANTVTYFVNNVQVSTGALATVAGVATTAVDGVAFLYDNYGSGFNIDNVVITAAPAGTDDFVKNNFNIYPNPATDVLNLTAVNNAAVNSISITDVNGRTVKQHNLNGVSSAQINVSYLNAGVYFVSVDSAEGKGTTKFVKR